MTGCASAVWSSSAAISISMRCRRGSCPARIRFPFPITHTRNVFQLENIMKLQHYLGGLENLGSVSLETKVFVAEWEKRIFGIHTVMMAASPHLDQALPKYPMDKVPTTFKEKWT